MNLLGDGSRRKQVNVKQKLSSLGGTGEEFFMKEESKDDLEVLEEMEASIDSSEHENNRR